MAIQRSQAFVHWNYFLALEEDLDRLSRFVDLGGNESVYSIETARLLLGASAEVDVVMKLLARRYVVSSVADSIGDYFRDVVPGCPQFLNFEVLVPRYGLAFHPWSYWSQSAPPEWWTAHNKVKHHRDQHFDRATLKNALNAIAGLFVCVLHLYENEALAGELMGLPRLLHVGDAHRPGTRMGKRGHSLVYQLR